VDIGNHYVTLGASASPSVLEGLTLGDIGSDLSSASSPVAQAIDGTANYLIAALCTMVQGTTPSLCSTPVIRLASKALATGVSSSSESPGVTTSPHSRRRTPTVGVASVERERARILASRRRELSVNECRVYRTENCRNSESIQEDDSRIPPGVTAWAISLEGKCPPGHNGEGLSKSP